MSLPDLSGFPRRVSAQSLLWLANLCGSIGRELELQQRAEEALERYMLGLRLLVMLRARRPWYALDKVGYWLMARSAPIVGELAARRQMSFEDMMEVFNENLEPYAGLLRDGSTRTPVAFALLAHARSLLNIVAGTQEVGSLRDDLIRVAPMAEPAEGAARQRFNGELRALMSEIDLLQHHRRGTEMFEWGKAAPENPAKSS